MTEFSNIDTPVCPRINHPDNYIELRPLESSPKAVDQLAKHLVQIFQASLGDEKLLIFINNSHSGTSQPIRHLMDKLNKERNQLKPKGVVRVAVNFHFMPIARLINLFVRSLRTENVKFYACGLNEETKALNWLLEK